jgi:uncharacterized protein (TIGR04255 family)
MMAIDNPFKEERLLNKPLAEAIFELRWALDEKSRQGLPVDPGFRLLVGRYYDHVKGDYPNVIDLPAAQIPEELTAYTVRHQFRASRDGWPVTQLGPGIVTVNETTAYSWETFKPRILSAIAALLDSYPREIAPCVPNEVMLRYLNATPVPTQAEGSLLGFLKESLHTTVSLEPTLFPSSKVAESPLGFNLNVVYPLEKPLGVITLTLALGKSHDVPSLIWELSVRSKGPHAPQERNQFETWTVDAHEMIENWFFLLCRGNLLDRFKGRDVNKNS